jgi:hypothetical protein
MTPFRKDPIASHAHTLPVVRENPPSGTRTSSGVPQPVVYAADAHAW